LDLIGNAALNVNQPFETIPTVHLCPSTKKREFVAHLGAGLQFIRMHYGEVLAGKVLKNDKNMPTRFHYFSKALMLRA